MLHAIDRTTADGRRDHALLARDAQYRCPRARNPRPQAAGPPTRPAAPGPTLRQGTQGAGLSALAPDRGGPAGAPRGDGARCDVLRAALPQSPWRAPDAVRASATSCGSTRRWHSLRRRASPASGSTRTRCVTARLSICSSPASTSFPSATGLATRASKRPTGTPSLTLRRNGRHSRRPAPSAVTIRRSRRGARTPPSSRGLRRSDAYPVMWSRGLGIQRTAWLSGPRLHITNCST